MEKYRDDFDFHDVPTKTPGLIIKGRDMSNLEFSPVHAMHAPLLLRRQEFGMTQQEVADAAHIQLRQYQRLESGERSMASASMRIGLSICRVLELDPYRFV